MPTILEPIGAGVLVALISKYVINNKPLCDSISETCETKEEEPEIVEECSSSNTTSVNSAELVHVHHFDAWMHT
jgi:hypothetical protein